MNQAKPNQTISLQISNLPKSFWMTFSCGVIFLGFLALFFASKAAASKPMYGTFSILFGFGFAYLLRTTKDEFRVLAVNGNYYEYKGVSLEVFTDTNHKTWVSLDDVLKAAEMNESLLRVKRRLKLNQTKLNGNRIFVDAQGANVLLTEFGAPHKLRAYIMSDIFHQRTFDSF